jgi:hypothetical protein
MSLSIVRNTGQPENIDHHQNMHWLALKEHGLSG